MILDSVKLFESLHPNFFEREDIRSVSEEWVYDEMLLSLADFDGGRYEKVFGEAVSFGFYDGDLEELKRLVATVDDGWPQFFDGKQRIYCGFVHGEVASFCQVEHMGVHCIDGQVLCIGGPGCVGTLPKYRDKGIGLTMVMRVTQLLKDEGYDYSYIHYTGVAPWYAKLGYKTILRWGRNGLL